MSYMARILWARGCPGQSDAMMGEALALARQGSNAVTVAAALVVRLFLAAYGAPLQEATACADEAIAWCREHELALFENWTGFLRGALQARQGDAAAGIVTMRAAIAAAAAKQSRQFRPFQLACVGAACAALGRFEEALTLFNEALALAEEGGERQSLSAILRLRGETLVRLGRLEEARREIGAAVATARQQGALMEELRAAMAAVRHADEHGRNGARAALTDVYLKFDEGHTLPDLRAAAELLGL
jgi:tetratricopeptide (TPR) repeat protein